MNKWVNKHSLSISGYLKIIPGRLVLGYETIVSDFESFLFYYKEESNTNQWPEALFSLQTAVVEGGSSWLILEDTFSAICHSRHEKKGDPCRPRGGAGWSLGWFPVYSLKTKHGHGSWAQKYPLAPESLGILRGHLKEGRAKGGDCWNPLCWLWSGGLGQAVLSRRLLNYDRDKPGMYTRTFALPESLKRSLFQVS